VARRLRHDLHGVGRLPAKTCAAAGKSWGTIANGCGGVLSCGGCTAPATCGSGGTANVCGGGTCTPTTCAAAGKNCGTISDGCNADVWSKNPQIYAEYKYMLDTRAPHMSARTVAAPGSRRGRR
jgi:hypothetical protein